MSLRGVFLNMIRDKFYRSLRLQPVTKDWGPSSSFALAEEIIRDKMEDISKYIQNNEVTIQNMAEHAQKIVDTILMPYVDKKRVE